MRWRLLQVERQWEDCCKSLLWLVFICVRVAGMWCCNLVHDFYSCTLSIDGRYPSSINCKKCFPMCFLMPKCISKLDVVLYALYRLCFFFYALSSNCLIHSPSDIASTSVELLCVFRTSICHVSYFIVVVSRWS